jgi:hypothetical protein
MEPEHCNSEHEILLYEVKQLHQKLDEIAEENKANTEARNKAEGIIGFIKIVGVATIISSIISVIGAGLYFVK